MDVAWVAVCDETQNLNYTDSETFSVQKFFETCSETLFCTKFFREFPGTGIPGTGCHTLMGGCVGEVQSSL